MRSTKLMVLCAVLTPLAVSSTYMVQSVEGNSTRAASEVSIPTKPYDPRPDFSRYQQNESFDEFAWDVFLYISWPALAGQRGKPDPDKTLNDRATTTWETWKDLREVLPPDGSKPALWSEPPPTGMTGFYNIPQIDGHFLKDVKGQPVWLGLRTNQAVFDYIVERGFYNANGQLAFVNDPEALPVDFSREAMEIKSSWIELDDILCNDDHCPYHVAELCQEGSCTKMGLIGLHIMAKVQDDWFWTTFEQVDNQKTTTAPETVQILSSTAAVNQKMQAALAGTVWQNYRTRGAQWSYVDPQGKPTLLSNTTIETRFQKTASCITCHALASRGQRDDGFISFFQLTTQGVGGYVGYPDWQLFCKDETVAAPIPSDPHGEEYCKKLNTSYRYRSMDFAWIFRLALRLQEAGQ